MTDYKDIFPWNKNFETGIESIDKQHMKLVEIINRLANVFVDEVDKELMDKVLDELTDYTVYHFTCEEGIWNNFFPLDEATIEHLKTHKDFIEKLKEFRKKYNHLYDDLIKANKNEAVLDNNKLSDMGFEMLSFLTNWLAFHILDTDRSMAETVIAIKSGMNINDAKKVSEKKMDAAKHLMIETILRMYQSLTSKTLQLMREVVKRKRAEKRLKLSKNAIDSSLESIFIIDSEGVIIEANPSFCAGVSKVFSDIVGRNISDVKPSIFEEKKYGSLLELAAKEGFWSGEILSIKADGSKEMAWLSIAGVIDEDSKKISHYSCVLSSVSHLLERKNMLEFEANHDLLTSLPNTRLLNDRLEHAIERSDRSGKKLAVCFMDLDGFKDVNDSFGHSSGDKLLCEISRRLEGLVRASDTVARIGGDEFVLLLEDLNGIDDALNVLDKVLKSIKEPVFVGTSEVGISASIGVVTYPSKINSYKDLLNRADAAMYDVKKSGKSQIKIWED